MVAFSFLYLVIFLLFMFMLASPNVKHRYVFLVSFLWPIAVLVVLITLASSYGLDYDDDDEEF